MVLVGGRSQCRGFDELASTFPYTDLQTYSLFSRDFIKINCTYTAQELVSGTRHTLRNITLHIFCIINRLRAALWSAFKY